MSGNSIASTYLDSIPLDERNICVVPWMAQQTGEKLSAVKQNDCEGHGFVTANIVSMASRVETSASIFP